MEFYKTNLQGIAISKNGVVKLNGKVLKIGRKGCFSYNGKAINLGKFMLEHFKGIKQRSGRLHFINNNCRCFELSNIEYKSKIDKIEPPSKELLTKVIKSYFGRDEIVNFKDVFKYRIQLLTIVGMRNFLEKYESHPNIKPFEQYISARAPSYQNIAKKFEISVNDARNTMYYFLHQLINDCLEEKRIKP